ncbi:AMP-binding protein [Borreliella burgdorferi]|uniref:Long-chain-fatty-acid CoA ligase n=3 Tax=Borreliella burgdorferi TaxID=139 RepID=O51539_BORBU|nr:AMP-binding protein [Borreliella burgdorferi]AAC66957.1 long-chain-fatty-acid CoA ligase [Borreliella burgdorferi B31]ADQ30638.1 long-chain-fatty-acid CoA ligase [Borreliella burgdorferi JD1]ARS30343.1 long-chain fatty acid--CoA ligase [Borreliella burgdorferi]ARS31574.1 long-chain fatty acid--CoA ligase [Borreliella burgdorferi]ARS33321.1 long-chain fatty acid--CoA ligase [Borreliella burgdorferi]
MSDTVPKRFKDVVALYSELDIFMYKEGESKSFKKQIYADFWNETKRVASGLLHCGIKRGEKVVIISDSRREWIIIDVATLGLGCVDVPRGNDSSEDELAYIINHSESTFIFVENNKQLHKVLSKKHDLRLVRCIVVIDDDKSYEEKIGNITVFSYKKLLELGTEYLRANPKSFDMEIEKGSSKDIATIIYTSGTTGMPKGVMLRHESFIFQLDRLYDYLPTLKPGKIMISILPLWHSFERACEYIVALKGIAIAYSKPIGPVLLKDFLLLNPQMIVSVPRIWEGIRIGIIKKVSESFIKKFVFGGFLKVGIIYAKLKERFLGLSPIYKKTNFLISLFSKLFLFIGIVLIFPIKLLGDILVFKKIKNALGQNFEFGVSGGGALVDYVDYFFKAVGIKVLEGYGLTETGPILSVRRLKGPVAKTVGPILPDVEYKVVGIDGRVLPYGEKGELWVRSPQIMSGYFKDKAKTSEVLTEDGWFNTGDLVRLTINNEISIVGRSKDTIVLRGGENIEPEPLERVLGKSLFIENIMIVGQDQKFLGAVIVPNFDNLEKWANSSGVSFSSRSDLLANEDVNKLYSKHISDTINTKLGFKNFEKIVGFVLLQDPFTIGEELTNTLKLKRYYISKKYEDKIKLIFSKSDLDLNGY